MITSVAISSTQTRFINKKFETGGNEKRDNDDMLIEVTTLSHPPGRLIKEDEKVVEFPSSNFDEVHNIESKHSIFSTYAGFILPRICLSC